MNFIINKEEYLKVRAEWIHPGHRHHDAADHIIYNALRGLDLKRGFSPIQSAHKLSNGASEWEGFLTAKSNAAWYIRDNAAWAHETPARTVSRLTEYKERIDTLSKKYGVTFTSELITTLRELLK